LIFDLGQSGGKVTIGYYNGKKIRLENLYKFDNDDVFAGGFLQWDILKLFGEVLTGIGKALSVNKDIQSLGIDSWGSDYSFIDKRGYLLGNPITNRDNRVKDTLNSFYKILSKKELFNLTGVQLSSSSSSSLMQLYSLIYLKSKIFSVAEKYLMIPDIINFFLTGYPVCEYTLMSFTQLVDQRKKEIIDYILNKYSIPKRVFPKMNFSGNILGNLKDDLSKMYGGRKIKVTTVAEHDTASAFTTIPFKERGKNCASIILGSWCVLGIEVNEPILTDEAFINGFANQGGVEGVIHFRKDFPGFIIADELRKSILNERCLDLSWDNIFMLVEKASPFEFFIDICDPIFSAPGKDMKSVFLNYFKESDQGLPENEQQIFRCIFEGMIFSFRSAMDVLQKIIGKKIDLIYIIGGGSRNKIINQWTANILKIPVWAEIQEATSIGNMLVQMKALKDLESVINERHIVNESFKFLEFYPENITEYEEAYNKYLSVIKRKEKACIKKL